MMKRLDSFREKVKDDGEHQQEDHGFESPDDVAERYLGQLDAGKKENGGDKVAAPFVRKK